jgi:hypothetical protein
MKKLVIQFEFPDQFDHEEVRYELLGAITDTNQELADQVTYTILERK